MSLDSGIEFTVEINKSSIHDVIKSLLLLGWRLDYDGHIHILPLGDTKEFAWIDMETSEQIKALEILKQKEEKGETIGVTLTWKDSAVGVDFLVFNKKTILFSLTVNRKVLENLEFTDVNWYLQRIIPAILSSGCAILHICWNESI